MKHLIRTALAMVPLLSAATALAWEQVDGTRLADVNPCPSDDCAWSGYEGHKAVVEAWNGAALDPSGPTLYVYGGGHTDYFGNEVYALDIADWRWRRLSEPAVPGDDFYDETAERTGRMPDGSPRVPHTYDLLVFEPTLDALLAIGAVGTSPNSIAGHRRVERFDVTTGTWGEPLAEAERINGYFLGGTARDADTGLIWVHTSGAGQLASYDPAVDRWSYFGRAARFKNFSLAAGDGQLLMLGGCGRQRCNHWLVNLNRPNADPVLLKGLADIAGTAGPGLTYNTKLNTFAAYVDGRLYHIDTNDRGSATPIADGPPSTPNGVFGRFTYVPSINAYVYVAAADQNVWVRYLDKDYGDAIAVAEAKQESKQESKPEPKPAIEPAPTTKPTVATATSRPVQDKDFAKGLKSWEQRSSAPGVQFAYRFDEPDQVYEHVLPDHPNWTNGAEHVSHTSEGMRMDILNTSTRQHGNWRHCLLKKCRGLEVGETVYVAHSQYFDAPMITEVYRRKNSRAGTGFKQTIISRYETSAPNGEIVLTNVGQRGYPQAYRKHRGKTASQFGGLVHQPAVKGGPVYEQKIKLGKLPRRFKGVAYPKDGWLHFKQSVTMASPDRAYYSLYAARPGEDWVKLIEDGDVHLVNNFQYNGMWLLPYTSNGAADPERSNTYTIYKDLIISTQDIAAPDGR